MGEEMTRELTEWIRQRLIATDSGPHHYDDVRDVSDAVSMFVFHHMNDKYAVTVSRITEEKPAPKPPINAGPMYSYVENESNHALVADDSGTLAYVRECPNGYEVCARWNAKGRFRVVERVPTYPQAELMVKRCSEDDSYRHTVWKDSRQWDFVEDQPEQKRERKPREPRDDYVFSFED